MSKCFCHFNGYEVKDAAAREGLEQANARLDNLVGNSGEQTEGNLELIDIRTAADGTVYPTAGDSVRGQITDLKSDLSVLKKKVVLTGSVGMYANGEGVTKSATADFDMYEPIKLTNGYKSIVVKNAKVNPFVKRFVFANTETLSLETSYTCINLEGNDADSFNGRIDIPKDYKFLFIAKNCYSDGVLENEAEYELTYDMEEVVGSGEVIQMLNLPEHYDIFVGDTLEIFYENIILAKNIDDIIVEVDCNVGQPFKSKYLYTPTENEKWNTFDFTVTLKDNFGRVIERGSTVINTVYKNPSGTFANVLCVGDSLTVNGKWAKTFKDRLAESGYNYVSLLGSCEYEGVNYEGYGGWTYNSYNTPNASSDFVWVNCTHAKTSADQHSVYTINSTNWKIETIEQNRIKFIRVSGLNNMPNSGVMTWVSGGNNHDSITFSSSALANGNPFWDDATGKVDFAKYMTRIGHDGELIDYCIVFLGWNQSTDTKEQFKNSVNTFCNNLRASYPDCKIIFIGLQVPSYDGIGNNYGCSWKWFEKKSFVFNVDKWYKEIISVLGDSTAIQLCGQFDTENNMLSETRQVNKRNPKTEIYGTNGVHPNDYGYMQIGDVIFNAFMSY